MGDFFNTLKGKIIAVLTIIALVFGIVAEGVSVYRNGEESKTATEIANNAAKQKLAEAQKAAADAEAARELARKAAADAETARAAADVAGKLKLAEAEEKTQLAKKAAADAEAARAAADNAGKLRLAEAEEKTHLAEKAAEEAKTAKAVAENSARLQASLAAKAQEEAENLRQKNKILRGFTDGGGDAHEMVQRDFNRQLDMLGIGNGSTTRRQGSEAPANTELSPKCRQHFAEWQGYTSHAAFAVYGAGECVWNGNGTLYQSSTAQAAAALKGYCNQKNLVCTIIATK